MNLSFSFVAVITLMLLLCEEEIVLVSLFSSLFHEAGHLFFILLFSDVPQKISFGAFGIRIERNFTGSISYKKEAVIALGGIAGNFILAFSSLIFYSINKSSISFKIFAVNIFVAVFNLLPVRQLDAGCFVNCVLQNAADIIKSERIMRCITLITVVFILVCCIIYNACLGFNISFIAVTVYLISITVSKELNNDK